MASAKPEPIRISVTMALAELTEAQAEVERTKEAWTRAMAYRDGIIRDMRSPDVKVPESTIMRRTGLSRDSINRIAHSAPRGVSEPTPSSTSKEES